MNLMMTHFSAVSLEIEKVMEVKEVKEGYLVTLDLLALVKVCSTMMISSMAEEAFQAHFLAVHSQMVEASVGEEFLNQ
jgi:3-dehydroquinate synthase class II